MKNYNEKNKLIDEIFCKYFGINWHEKKGTNGKAALWTGKTEKGNRSELVAVFDGGKLLQAAYFRNGAICTKYNGIAELLTAAQNGSFGRVRV